MLGGVSLSLNVETIVPFIENLFGMHFLDPGVYYISTFPSDMRWHDVWQVCGMAFVLSLLATIYPSWRASRVQPAEALRYE
jgi:lipoprotein-releasing system permease protein